MMSRKILGRKKMGKSVKCFKNRERATSEGWRKGSLEGREKKGL